MLLAGAAHAQTAPPQTPPATPASPGTAVTFDLNSSPPVPATYLAPAPAPVPVEAPSSSAPATRPPETPRAAPVIAPTPTPAPAPRAAVPAPRSAAPASAASALPPRTVPAPADPAPPPRSTPGTPPVAAPSPRTAPPTAAPAAVQPAETLVPAPAVEPTPPLAAPGVTVLDSAARAALPFTADLPPGFEIVTGRPGPDFNIYTIRGGGRSFVMIYAGPASQFPIYSGQMVEAGGRASVVSAEDGVRHAMEHLFQRPDAPREIHVWTMSLDGADRALAERIAQSVDVR